AHQWDPITRHHAVPPDLRPAVRGALSAASEHAFGEVQPLLGLTQFPAQRFHLVAQGLELGFQLRVSGGVAPNPLGDRLTDGRPREEGQPAEEYRGYGDQGCDGARVQVKRLHAKEWAGARRRAQALSCLELTLGPS